MKRTFLAMSILLGLSLAMPAMAAKENPKDTQSRQQIKIGIVDMQKVVRESRIAKAVRGNFLKEVEAKKAQLVEKMQDVQKQEEELKSLDPSVSVEIRRQKTDKLKHDGRDLNNLRQDLEAEVKRKELEISQKLFVEIMQIIRNYAKTERYTLILERSTVVTAEESVDVTDKILKIYDAQKK